MVTLPVFAGTTNGITSPTWCVPKVSTCDAGSVLATTGRWQTGAVVVHWAEVRQTLPYAAQQAYPVRQSASLLHDCRQMVSVESCVQRLPEVQALLEQSAVQSPPG